MLDKVTAETDKARVPLKTWEFNLEKPVLFLILPLFAITNGAININASLVHEAVSSTLFWGIFLGLVLGKPLGIITLTYLALHFKVGKLPDSMVKKDILSIAFVAGIGYTMSIFISDLAFTHAATIQTAKLSIIISSFVAGLIGSVILIMRQPGSDY